MINEITIKNFKSINKLTLKLGRFNIFIGSNGSGKSNILEAIAFGGAASADKLDNEYFAPRGIRAAEAFLMKNAFFKTSSQKPIQLSFKSKNKAINFTIDEKKGPVLKWYIKEKAELEKLLLDTFNSFAIGNIDNIPGINEINDKEKGDIKNFSSTLQKHLSEEERDDLKKMFSEMSNLPTINNLIKKEFYNKNLVNFLIYSPELTSLRKIEEESQIKPLGIKGEGLFNTLNIFKEYYKDDTLEKIKDFLHIIEWFDDFEAIYDKTTSRKALFVKDRFVKNIKFNEKNVNEGFLFLMFYASLFLSNETPPFFAIDNIEASLHPMLCEELIRNLVIISDKKQVILTTHNPFVLDGLDLNDPEQRLFVVRRNPEGETIADQIKKPIKLKLSEAWMRGIFGGNPETI